MPVRKLQFFSPFCEKRPSSCSGNFPFFQYGRESMMFHPRTFNHFFASSRNNSLSSPQLRRAFKYTFILLIFITISLTQVLKSFIGFDFYADYVNNVKSIENNPSNKSGRKNESTTIVKIQKMTPLVEPAKKIRTNNDHTFIKEELIINTTIPSSSSSSSEKHLCTREEIKMGSWVPITLKKPPYISRTTHLRCYPLEKYKKGYWNTYDWEPTSSSNCNFVQWQRKPFCSLLKKSTVMIIGDSLSWEHYSSLVQLLGMKIRQMTHILSKQYQRNYIQLACQNQVRLVFRRDDLLTNLTSAIKETFPQVLVVNRGAHYHNDTRLLPEIKSNFEEIKAWQDTCDKKNITCHLFWRTSVPGHPLCDKMNFTKPINDLSKMESWINNRSNYNNYTSKYHWYDYQHQNEWVLDLLDQMLGQQRPYDVLDAYHLNVRRPDEHRSHQGDCLHNCYPGKMDVYNRLLLHFLTLRRTKADIEGLEARYLRSMAAKHREESHIIDAIPGNGSNVAIPSS